MVEKEREVAKSHEAEEKRATKEAQATTDRVAEGEKGLEVRERAMRSTRTIFLSHRGKRISVFNAEIIHL